MQHKPLESGSTSSSKVKQRRTTSQWQDLMNDYENSGLSQLSTVWHCTQYVLQLMQEAKGGQCQCRLDECRHQVRPFDHSNHITASHLSCLIGARSRMRIHNSTYKAWQDSDANVIFADEIEMKDKLVITTAILISRETAKAAEDFLVYADGVKHFKTIGEPTFGSTGQPLTLDLPGGGGAKICTKRETFADGRDFVGFGIQPDIGVKRDANYYLSQTDITLDTAHKWLVDTVKKPLW